jgi:hypothetical protein
MQFRRFCIPSPANMGFSDIHAIWGVSRNCFGARLCEPQHVESTARWKLLFNMVLQGSALRVTDPRSDRDCIRPPSRE